ncbi:genetic competence negative regulator [Bacillus taeanensis]|uniref:Adapter protein MecA n=1 Tax=Bacillus taeanensis TaxID=273032 RepID=A0A366Y1N3_9BACI|nr:genetic competence negative regulator [Bacillus taeanensis]RBW70314.1 genetic competence negative regulator [Bacillus taeanensis]
MRLERLTYNKIKVFLTFDDLNERGITKEELWQDVPKVQQLFREMMLEADDELGFKADGPIAVEVFALPAQGMIVIVTKESTECDFAEEYEDDFIEMQVTLDESDEIFYTFSSFEDVISLSQRLYIVELTGGRLFSYEDRFYLEFSEEDLKDISIDQVIALLAEFGSPSTLTSHRVIEYGKILIGENAVAALHHYFWENRS